jgi:hypothetical protein
MPFVLVFLFELILLATLTSHSSSYFLRFFHSVIGSQKVAIILFSVLFFPGTFVHELAHFLMAKLLFVYSGKMEFLPQIQGDAIKLGSVSIAKTDPIRRLLIGVAPVIFGLIVLLGLLWMIRQNFSYLSSYPWAVWFLLGYVVFVTGSTMFSSRKDLEGSLGVIIAALILLIIVYVIGFDWVLWSGYQYLSTDLNDFFKQLSGLLLIPIGANSIISLIGWSATKRM